MGSRQENAASIRAFQLPFRFRYNPYVSILRFALENANFEFDGIWPVRGLPRVILLHWQESHWVGNVESVRVQTSDLIIRNCLLNTLRTLRARGCVVVWFAHNAMPHDWLGSIDEWIHCSRKFFEQIDAVVHLTDASMSVPEFDHLLGIPRTVIRHPHYALVDRVIHARQAGEIQRVIMLGAASQPRKNAYAAAAAIQDVPNLRAVITGDLNSDYARGFAFYPKVDLLDGILGERSLFSLFDGGTAVLLNQVNQLNSGVTFLGLSRGAPVICPDTPTNREIRSMVGPEWIRLFEHPLTSEQLRELTCEPINSELPDLSPFDPDSLGRSFREWFEKQVELGTFNRNH